MRNIIFILLAIAVFAAALAYAQVTPNPPKPDGQDRAVIQYARQHFVIVDRRLMGAIVQRLHACNQHFEDEHSGGPV